MAKTLNQFLEGYLKVKNPDEQKFVDKHVVAKHADRNGNDDEVFKGSKVKMADRRKDRHGYNPGEDEKVYEELKGSQHKIDANKNGKVDAHDFHLLRKKKKVAEEAEELDELSKSTMGAYTKKAAADFSARKPKMGYDGQLKKMQNRTVGVNRALNKMYGEEAEQIDETAKIVAHLQKRYGDNIRKSHVSSAAKDFGVDVSKLAKAVRTKLGKNMLDEEQIDEISATTKDSYAKKAVKQLPGLFKKSGETADDARKYYNRKNTVRKIANEEAEQIDELSKKTMGSYIKKASGAEQPKNVMSPKNVPLTKIAAYQGDSETGYFGKRFNQHTYDKAERLRKNRETGIKRATDKLTKEEVEAIEEKLNMDTASMGTVVKDFQKSDAPQFKGKSQDKRRAMAIAAKLTAERGGKPLRKEEKLADLLGDLTETHRRTMLSVFDKLNEGNQKKFLEACETPEGVESMLDFSISHRGE
jgi:hypothetical protein